MTETFFMEKLDDFRVEVIDRLARIETKHDLIIQRLDLLNGTVKTHGVRIDEHDRQFGIRKLLVERGHFQLRARDEIAGGFAPRREFLLRQHRRHDKTRRIEPELLQATRPRLRD